MISLKSIARELKVSPAVVSVAISGKAGTTGCSARTRQRILQKVRQLGYRPHAAAAALASGRNHAIAVFIHTLGAEGSGLMERFLDGLATALNKQNQRLWLTFYQTDQEFLLRTRPGNLRDVDGLIVAGVLHKRLNAPLHRIEKTGIRVVTVMPSPVGRGIPNIYSDDEEQTLLATNHLAAMGCRRIATLATFASRLRGYQKALASRGLPCRPELVFRTSSFHAKAGIQAVRHWLGRKRAFDGIVAQSDHQAFGATQELILRGIRVPGKVRVIGVDDSPLCRVSPVSLSSVSQEMEEIGKRAVEAVLDRIAGREILSVVVPPVLRLRESA